jgi:hypothetical protein
MGVTSSSEPMVPIKKTICFSSFFLCRVCRSLETYKHTTTMLHQKILLVNVARRSPSLVLSRNNRALRLTAMTGVRHLSSVVLQEVEDDIKKQRQEELKGMLELKKKQLKEVKERQTEMKQEAAPETSAMTSPSHLNYVGETRMPITSKLRIVTPSDDTPSGIWPAFRLMVRLLRSSHCLLS